MQMLKPNLYLYFPAVTAKAGILSGFPGIESVPGPQLPQIEFLDRFNGNYLHFIVYFVASP